MCESLLVTKVSLNVASAGQRLLVAHNVGFPMRHVHSLPCYESPAHLASSRRSFLLLTVCYLLSVSQGLLFQSLLMTSSLVDAFPGRVHLQHSHNAACVRRVKLHLPYSPVAAEIAYSSANQWNRGSCRSGLIKITRTPASTKYRLTTFRVLRYVVPALCCCVA
jgi:hypothetical protein